MTARLPRWLASWLRYGLPCAAVWLAYLLAFWPGILTEDSFEQWADMTSGVIRGYHSPLQTILHWLLTRVWDSPAMLVLAQIAALSAAYTMVAAECAARGAPRWLLAATTTAMALLPGNGFMVVSLWKDVPYAVALLWVTGSTLKLARSNRPVPAGADLIWMAVALTAVAGFRHNGPPTVALVLIALAWAVPAPRRRLWPLAALTLAGVLAIQVGLFGLVGVRPYHPAFRDQTILHQTAAGMQTGIAYDAGDYAALARIMPLAIWARGYRCDNVVPTLAGVLAHVPAAEYARLRPALYRTWWHAVVRAPGAIAVHHACVTGMIWNPLADYHLASTAIVDNGYGLATRPVLPRLNRVLTDLLERTSRGIWRAVLWNLAGHLFLVVAAVVWALWRRIDRVVVVAVALPLLHTAILLIAIPAADYRLQYPVVPGSLVTPLILAAARPRAPGIAPSTPDPRRSAG